MRTENVHLTVNQRYGGFNRRYDKRAKLLFRLGYNTHFIPEFGIVVFTKGSAYDRRTRSIPADVVLRVDRDEWLHVLETKLRRS